MGQSDSAWPQRRCSIAPLNSVVPLPSLIVYRSQCYNLLTKISAIHKVLVPSGDLIISFLPLEWTSNIEEQGANPRESNVLERRETFSSGKAL